MTDFCDKAAELEQQMRDVALQNARNAAKASTRVYEECTACGDHIPAARRAAVPGCALCARCATRQEQIDKQRKAKYG